MERDITEFCAKEELMRHTILKYVKILVIILASSGILNAMQTHDNNGVSLSENQRQLNAKLKMAIVHKKPDEVKNLLALGANPNAFDVAIQKYTLLMMAVERIGMTHHDLEHSNIHDNSTQIIQELICAGADAHFKNTDNENALDLARKYKLPQSIINALSRQEKG